MADNSDTTTDEEEEEEEEPTTSRYYKRKGNMQIPTSTKADRIVLMTMGGTLGIVVISHFAKNPIKSATNPGILFRTSAGAIIAGTVLMVIAQSEPQLAIGISYLILFGTLLNHGKQVGDVMSNLTHAKPSATSTPQPNPKWKGFPYAAPTPTRQPIPITPVFPTMHV